DPVQELTDAENALVDEFTEEQEAALEAKRAELLGEEDEEDEETTSSEKSGTWSIRPTEESSTWVNNEYVIEQGGSQTVPVVGYISRNSLSYQCEREGITAERNKNGNGYTIRVDPDVPDGTYELNVQYISNGKSTTDIITVKVKAPDTSAYTFTVTPVLSNVEVAYFAYHTEADTENVELKRATNGSNVVIENFSYNQDGYIVFFVKPNDNYLLTNATGTGNNDVYDINLVTTTGNIRSYPGLEKIVEVAKGAGYEYIGVLGYSRRSGDAGNMNQTITLSAKSPDIEVTAVSSKNTGVKPGDTLTFTVTITPGTIAGSAATVSGVEITSLTINDVNAQYSELVDNGDGTYTTTVTYTATQADCDAGSVKLDVTANVSYQNLLGVTDNQTLASQATITKSASVECSIAPKNRVVYRLTYVAEGIDESTYPDVIKTKPNDETDVYEGQEVDVENNFYAQTTVDDPVNRGTWTFDGWYQDGAKVGDKVTMGAETIYLEGTWTFESYPNADLIIKKTISGNMYNANDKFTFTVTIDGETLSTFDLGNEETKTISIQNMYWRLATPLATFWLQKRVRATP
ncbi:MAG: SHIRT domain-containing protein, partial [Eubacteriales bacterium]|nr:SHIRT domain-containing protein [Eubacteriales bacterium]